MTATTEVSIGEAAHGHAASAKATKPAAEAHGQQHPLKLYLFVWALLFILSTFSYLIDYFDLQGMLRWSLIILFMLLKAGFIIAIFMHMAWERLALVLAILLFEEGEDQDLGAAFSEVAVRHRSDIYICITYIWVQQFSSCDQSPA